MKFKRLLFLVIVLTTQFLVAQTDFRPGYVITEIGDTIVGEIDYRGDLLMGQLCKFKSNESNIVIEYLPDEIIAYRFTDSKYYASKEIVSTKVFLEILIKGKANIYYLRDENGDHYYIDKEDLPLTEIPYKEEIKTDHGTNYLSQSKTHIGILTYYMQDAPLDFQAKIKKIKKPETDNLVKLAEDYNNVVCQGEKCIVFEKKEPFAKVNIELAGGVTSFYKFNYVDNHVYFLAGFIAHFWMPRVNEKLFVRTGALYSIIKHKGVQEYIFKIPLQLEYICPKNTIRPKAAIGIFMYKPFGQTIAVMAGVNIKMYKKFFLSLDYDIEISPSDNIPVIPKRMIAQSFLAGMYYKF